MSEAIVPIELDSPSVEDDGGVRLALLVARGLASMTYDELNEAYRLARRLGVEDAIAHVSGGDARPLWETYLREPKDEREARDHFAAQMGGQTEVGVAFGRVDALIESVYGKVVVEVEPYARYPHGVRQALAYARMTHHAPGLAVYGKLDADQARSLATRVRGWCDLYLLDGDWQWCPDPSFAERSWSGLMWRGRRGPTVRDWYRERLQQQEQES